MAEKKSARRRVKSAAKASKKAVKKGSKGPVKKAVKKVGKKAAGRGASKPAAKVVKKKVAKKAASAGGAKGTPVAGNAVAGVPVVGTAAPGFALPASDGTTVRLADYAGKTVVLYFYPRADTPGCTKQACGFRDAIASYRALGVPVFGVSPDPVGDVTKFAAKFSLNFPLLADADHAVCEAYGVWVEKSMYGKTYMGAARTTFIVRDGKVAKVFEKVNPEGHDVEVLEALKSL